MWLRLVAFVCGDLRDLCCCFVRECLANDGEVGFGEHERDEVRRPCQRLPFLPSGTVDVP